MIKNKIQTFIEKNKLNFNVSDSTLNSNCTIIAGYALFCGITEYDDLLNIILDYGTYKPTERLNHELKTVFNFAKGNNYGDWWKREESKKQYIF